MDVEPAPSTLGQRFLQQWSAACTQLVVAAASFTVFVVLHTLNYLSNDGSVLFFAILATSAGAGLAFVRLRKLPREAPTALERRLTLALLTFGIAGFIVLDATATIGSYEDSHDGYVYLLMGESFARNGTFTVLGGFSHHFPPAYPLYLSVFYLPFGATLGATMVATGLMHLIALAVVYWTTKRMFDPARALRTTAIVSCLPALAFFDARNSAEHLVLAAFALTIYCIWKSLTPSTRHYIVYAGLFAGVGYLTKSSLGYFFILAGLAGLVWRLRFGGVATVRDRSYLLAIGVFGACVAAWGARNLYRFWDGTPSGLVTQWQSSDYFPKAQDYTLGHEPLTYAGAVGLYTAMGLVLFFGYLWPVYPQLRRSFAKIRREEESFFWLAVGTTFFISVLISALFWVFEVHDLPQWFNYTPPSAIRYFDFTFVRYGNIVLLPALWAAYRQAQKDAEGERPDSGTGGAVGERASAPAGAEGP